MSPPLDVQRLSFYRRRQTSSSDANANAPTSWGYEPLDQQNDEVSPIAYSIVAALNLLRTPHARKCLARLVRSVYDKAGGGVRDLRREGKAEE